MYPLKFAPVVPSHAHFSGYMARLASPGPPTTGLVKVWWVILHIIDSLSKRNAIQQGYDANPQNLVSIREVR